jgi:hypothetical protein
MEHREAPGCASKADLPERSSPVNIGMATPRQPTFAAWTRAVSENSAAKSLQLGGPFAYNLSVRRPDGRANQDEKASAHGPRTFAKLE